MALYIDRSWVIVGRSWGLSCVQAMKILRKGGGGGLSRSTNLKVEWTEGRMNYTKNITEPESGTIETAWLPGTDKPLQMVCTIICDSTATRNGGLHKGSKSHYNRPRYYPIQAKVLMVDVDYTLKISVPHHSYVEWSMGKLPPVIFVASAFRSALEGARGVGIDDEGRPCALH
ncbi:hypothetical protein HYPSUDRAFT_59870 [Hypholoma sublateritium FD-334 SS-4]|uniref:Uncharacterized protein n=1 Tax=Hypholoma sublateritium (strain FD-334 SS-4) TaxID=945553 RepID=A0A0D2KG51_HYPSF|nr:hypothetical protein HYPSUDRAFT_59870 [Hypholoma sublateritium FD-334 SS-4]